MNSLAPVIDLTPARNARLAYEDAITTDGVSAASWRRIDCHRARATDAEQRAQYAERMVQAARTYRVIDMATIGGGL